MPTTETSLRTSKILLVPFHIVPNNKQVKITILQQIPLLWNHDIDKALIISAYFVHNFVPRQLHTGSSALGV